MPSTGKIKIILFLSIVFLLAGLSVFFIPAPEPAKGLSNDKYLAASCTAQYYCYRNQWRYRNRSCNVFLLATCASGCCTASGCKSATSSNWSGWTDTSACSGTCGGGTGTKTQSRTCQGAVSCGGTNNCTGPSTQTVSCTNNSCCSVNGGWTATACGNWSTCTRSCGTGTQSRTCSRTCTNPSPSCNGANCSGSSSWSESQYCNTQSCCTDNGSTCNYSDSCDTTGNNNCGVEVSRCNRTTSSSNYWGGWYNVPGATCTKSCGGGTIAQWRDCQGTVSCGGTNNCGGQTRQSQNAPCNTQVCPVAGLCGTANKTYAYNATSFGSDSYCGASNTSSPVWPAFPAQGASSSWTCTGAYGGTTANCAATRKLAVPTVSVAPNPVARGGTVTFTWGAVTNATYYYVNYFRDSVGSGWTNVGNVTSVTAPTAGATQTIGVQVTAYSSYAYSNASSITQATIAPVPTAAISASPASIGFNTSSQLIWSSTNASTCAITGNGSTWTGTSSPAPGQSTGNLTATQTYTITCNGQAGQVATNTVTVNVGTAVVAISSLTTSPLSGAGTAPLTVSFTIGVGGSAIGSIHYQIDCTNNSSYEFDVSTSANPYTAVNACNYPIGGSYTPRVKVTRSSVSATQTPNYSVIFTQVTADIKAQFGASPASDGPINMPINSRFTLSWQTTGGTSCKTTGGGSWQPNVSLALAGNPLSGSMTRTMGSSSETYPMSCTIPGGGTTPDTVTVNPIPLVPVNFRITSAAPYIKGNAISFAWDAAPAATQYVVTFFGNGDPILPPSMPSPASATTISYANTAAFNSLGAVVAACRSAGVCGPATAIVTANLIAPTPGNTTPTVINTTNNSTTGYASNLGTTSDVKYTKVPVSTTDQVYRLQTSGSATPTMVIVDANGNSIAPTATTDIQISGNTAVFKVPANAAYFIKFTGTSGNFTYGFQRYRNVPYYQGL